MAPQNASALGRPRGRVEEPAAEILTGVLTDGRKPATGVTGSAGELVRPAAETRRRVVQLLGLVLRRELSETENPARAEELTWDSLKHVELMFLLEDEFGVRFSEEEMAEMEDVTSIVRVLESHQDDAA